MKILLIYTRFGGGDVNYVDLSFRMPLGIAYLGSILKEKGFDVELRDGIFYSKWMDFENNLKKIKPDVVGISFTSSLKEIAKNYVKIVRKVMPKALIVAGGAHPTIDPTGTINDIKADVAVYGEGERTFPELMNYVKKNKKIEKNSIRGIAYKIKGKVEVNPPREMINDLDNIPWPAREMLPMKRYLNIAPLMPLPYPSTNILVSKGCPGCCLFCQPTLRKLVGNKVRYRSVEDVVKEIKFLIKRYKIKGLDLGVDEPTYDEKWVERFCDALIKEKIKIKWGAPSRVDTVNRKLLKKMGKAGCVYLSYGIESGSQKIMTSLGKGTTVKQASDALKWTEEAGICGRANIMVGSIGETPKTIQETIDFIKKTKPDFIFVAATTPLYGTALYDLAKKKGILMDIHGGVTGYDFGHLKLKEIGNDELKESLKQIVKTYKRSVLGFVFNPIMLWRKRHLYWNILMHFLSLLKNKKELIRMVKYYTHYGEQIKIKEQAEEKK